MFSNKSAFLYDRKIHISWTKQVYNASFLSNISFVMDIAIIKITKIRLNGLFNIHNFERALIRANLFALHKSLTLNMKHTPYLQSVCQFTEKNQQKI